MTPASSGQKVIYALTDPRDGAVKYVGATGLRVERRLALHLTPRSLSFAGARSAWIQGLLDDGLKPAIRVLEVVAEDGWEEAERRWIAFYGSKLTNVALGGHGSTGSRRSAESRARTSAALRGRVMSPETRSKLSEIAKRQSRARSERMKNRVISDETRRRMSEAANRRWARFTAEADL